MLRLKLQFFGYLMGRDDSFQKTLVLGKIETGRRRGRQRMRWLDVIINSVDLSLSKPCQLLTDREAWHAAVHGVTKNQTRLSDWTELNCDRWLTLNFSHLDIIGLLWQRQLRLSFWVCLQVMCLGREACHYGLLVGKATVVVLRLEMRECVRGWKKLDRTVDLVPCPSGTIGWAPLLSSFSGQAY